MPRTLCQALTQRTARPCKHRALMGSDYCACHAHFAETGENVHETDPDGSFFERLPRDVLFQHIVGKYLDCEDLAVLACTSKGMVRLLEKPMRCLHTPIELLKALLLRDARILLDLVQAHDFKAHASIHYRSPPGAPGLTISLIADVHTPAICFHIYSYLHRCMESAEMWSGTLADTQRCMDAVQKHAVVPRELQRLRGGNYRGGGVDNPVFRVDPAIRLYCNRELITPEISPLTESDYQKLEALRYPRTYGKKVWIWPTRPDVHPRSTLR